MCIRDRFIANLHGTASDERSWILIQRRMRELQSNTGYNTFITSCLSSRTILFVGISADDVAVGGYLDAMTQNGIDLGDHFWVTNRLDDRTEEWAERSQLQLIKYVSDGRDHSELKEILAGLTEYRPKDELAEPIVMARTQPTIERLSPSKLIEVTDPETLRRMLNAYAVTLLTESTSSKGVDYHAYEQFCNEYDEVIYRAWYVTSNPPNNKLFGYTIEEPIAEGAFGQVYKARDSKGRLMAVKVLREAVRKKPEMLQSFRRGVRSMRILANRRIEGMIPYEEASEIPAVAVMEFVEGPNLQEAVKAGYCDDWASVLDIAVQIANIIRRAHLLPERVLHRDLRPPNIMLRDYYANPGKAQVVVLDFDLSWHLGAQELSIVNNSSFSGFLAPEQVITAPGVSTRSAAVDSYGIGMTLYYLRSGKEPQFQQHRYQSWEKDLWNTILAHPCSEWHSIPNRFARLIFNCTKHEQSQRWDMGQIEGELELLLNSVFYPTSVDSTELIAEELARRIVEVSKLQPYQWDPDKVRALVGVPDGAEMHITAKESDRTIVVNVDWSSTGTRSYENIRKYLKPRFDNAISSLQARGWTLEPLTYVRSSEAGFVVKMAAGQLLPQIHQQSIELSRVLSSFNF